MCKVKMVCGSGAVGRISYGYPLEKDDPVSEYSFLTEAERNAFVKGAESAVGWAEIYFPDEEEWDEYKGDACIHTTEEI